MSLLRSSLSAAVPLWIKRWEDASPHDRHERLKELNVAINESDKAFGEDLQFGGKPGRAAEEFNWLAESIALMSFVPGGIRAFNLRFCMHQDGYTGFMGRCEEPPHIDYGTAAGEPITVEEVGADILGDAFKAWAEREESAE